MKRYYKVIILTCVLLLFSVLVYFKINGSSVTSLNIFYNSESFSKDDNLVLGVPRSIRSDEWLVFTPFFSSQFFHQPKLPAVNYNRGLGQQTIVTPYFMPNTHWTSFFKPHYYGSFFLDVERAFSFYWWFKIFIFLISFYFFLKIVTKRSFISIVLPFLFLFSPYIQWTLSPQPYIEQIAYLCLSFIFFFFALKKTTWVSRLLCLFGSYFFFMSFIFLLYLPSQIVLVFVFIPFFLGILINDYVERKNTIKTVLINLLMVGVPIFLTLLIVFLENREVINIYLNTAYPGKRFVSGGSFSFLHFINGFYSSQLLNNGLRIPLEFGGNQSEAANFLLYFPYILLIVIYKKMANLKNRKKDFMFIALIGSLLIILVWLFVGLPKNISAALLLNRLPLRRTLLGIGVLNVLFIALYLKDTRSVKERGVILVSILLALFAVLVNLILGFYLRNIYPDYISNVYKIFILSLFSGVTTLLLLLKLNNVFFLISAIYIIVFTLPINPVYVGLDPIVQNILASQVKKSVKRGEGIIVYNDWIMSDILSGSGIKVLNPTHIDPQLKLWKVLDPQNKQVEIYNRYAHIVFYENESRQNINYKLISPDLFAVYASPCNKRIKALGYKYVLQGVDFNAKTKKDCLTRGKKISYYSHTFYLYKVN